MYLNDTNWQFTIVSGQSNGGSSLSEGEAEIMIHRRLLRDYSGIGQPLDDKHETTPRFFIISDTPTNSSTLHRRLANVIQYPIQTFYLKNNNFPLLPSYSALQEDLPYNIRLISLKQRDSVVSLFKKILYTIFNVLILFFVKSNVVILRLMNIFEYYENPEYAVPTEINLNTLFKGYIVVCILLF